MKNKYNVALVQAFALLILSVTATSPVSAESYSDHLMTVTIPDGFINAGTRDLPNKGITVAYTKKYPDVQAGTLFQITRVDMGSKLKNLPKEKLQTAATAYLYQLLTGIERRRENFEVANPENIELNGIPAVRTTWRGIHNKQAVSGVMYSVIVGTYLVSMHTQDRADAPPENRSAALEAFDSISFTQPAVEAL